MVRTSEQKVPARRTNAYRPRTIEYEARAILRKRGFPVVIRNADAALPVSLIAWSSDGGVHFYRVVASRRAVASASDAAALFPDEIGQLRTIPRSALGTVNLWIHHEQGWKCYQVFSGGLAEEVAHVA